jgi:acetyltransferase
MERAGIPVFSTPELAAQVLGEMHAYGLRRRDSLIQSLERHLSGRSFVSGNKPVRFRALRPGDKELWTDFVNGCSQDSLWLRFLSPFSPTPERAHRFCDIDPHNEFAIVAETMEHDRRKVIGIARLIKLNIENKAEYAVIVSDVWQRKTLGFQLSQMSVELARHWGVSSVTAETIHQNYPIIKVLKRCRFRVQERYGNMVSLSLKLQ